MAGGARSNAAKSPAETIAWKASIRRDSSSSKRIRLLRRNERFTGRGMRDVRTAAINAARGFQSRKIS